MTQTPIANTNAALANRVPPVDRTPMLAVRGRRADIAASLNDLHEGELAWAEDEGVLYIVVRNGLGAKELHQASAGVYIATGAPAIQGNVPPTGIEIGTVWFDTTKQALFIWDGAQWRGIGDDAPTVIGGTRPVTPVDRQFWLDTSNAQQPRLFIYDATAGQWLEVVPPMASATDAGLMSQADFLKLQGLTNAPVPDWNAGPGVPGEILNKPTVHPPPPHATTTQYGVVILAEDADLGDPQCRDKVVVAAQIAWLKTALDWWRSTWLPGNHLSCGKEDVAIWNGKDDVLEVLGGTIEINVDGRGWSRGPEPVRRGMNVEARWALEEIVAVDDGDAITGSIVAPGEGIREDYDYVVHRDMSITAVPPVIDVPLEGRVTSDPIEIDGSNAPYQIWVVSEAAQAEYRIDDGPWMPANDEPTLHDCSVTEVQVRHIASSQINTQERTWVFAGTRSDYVSTAFHTTTIKIVAPDIRKVSLHERNPGGLRFTGQTFDLQALMAEPGIPVAPREARFEVMGRIDRPLQTVPIATVDGAAITHVRATPVISKKHHPSAPRYYPCLLGSQAPKELEDPAKARYYVPTSVPDNKFNSYQPGRGVIPMADGRDELFCYLVDLGASVKSSVVLPWQHFPVNRTYRGHGILRVYRWDAASGWTKDGELSRVTAGTDWTYELKVQTQWLVVAIEVDEDDVPHLFRIDVAPELTLTFSNDRDLAALRPGDRVKQDNAGMITGRNRLPILEYENKLSGGLDSVHNLPYYDVYKGLGATSDILWYLPRIYGYGCAWIHYRSDQAGPGVMGVAVRRRRGSDRYVKLYITVRAPRNYTDDDGNWDDDWGWDDGWGHHDSRIIDQQEVTVDTKAVETTDPDQFTRISFSKLPPDGWITLTTERSQAIYIYWFGGVSSVMGPAGTVVSSDAAGRTLILRDVSGSFAVGRTVLGPRQIEEDLHRWLDVDPYGVVRGMLPSPPAWREYPFVTDAATIRFPDIWDSGRAPDVDLPPGIALGAAVRVVNVAGSDQAAAAPIVPGNSRLTPGVAQQAFEAYETARVTAVAAAETRLNALGLSKVDIAALHL